MKKLLTVLALALIVSCSKDEAPCLGTGGITLTSRNIIGWQNEVNVIIEIKGIDGPYHGFIEPLSKKEHRVEGHAMVRVRTACSDWGQWFEINY